MKSEPLGMPPEDEEFPSPPPPRDPVATMTPDRPEMSNAWMITLADLLALVLTFFVLLYSMSNVRTAPWEEVVISLSQRLNPRPLDTRPVPVSVLATPGLDRPSAKSLDYLYAILKEKIRRMPALNADMQLHEDQLVISLESDVFFSPGRAELQKTTLPLLAELGTALQQLNNRIDVYGHTDPRPIKTAQYPSNWELSLARAATIARTIAGAGYNKPIRSFGLADARFNDISTSLTAAQRYNLARRVDIVIRDYLPEAP